MEEFWKDISGYEKIYQISNLGNVRNSKQKLLKVWSAPNKYNRITLEVKGLKKSFTIHRLVAIAFIDNPLQKKTVNHIDGNKNNPCVSNLEWATINENMKHAFDTGLLDGVKILKGVKGGLHPYSKLKDIDILMIKCLSENGFSNKIIADKFGVHQTHIGLIVNLKSRNNG